MAFTPEQVTEIKNLVAEVLGTAGVTGDVWTMPWPDLAVSAPKLTEANVGTCIEYARKGLDWTGTMIGDRANRRRDVDALAALTPAQWSSTGWAKYNVERDFVFVGILMGMIKLHPGNLQTPTQPDNYENISLVMWLEAQFKNPGTGPGING